MVGKRDKRLSAKKQLFVDAYLLEFNGTQAALKAGYSEASASSMGSQLLKDARVKKAIEERLEELRQGIGSDYLLSNFQRFFDADISQIKRVEDIPDQLRKYVCKVEVISLKDGETYDKITWLDKNKILDLMGRLLGVYSDKKEVHHHDMGSQIIEARARAKRKLLNE